MRKVVLLIMDGWGLAPAWGGNAIEIAETPNIDVLWRKYPHLELKAAEEAVGLPRHEPGNSEVGHLNLGSGQIVYQNLPGITATIENGSFAKNKIILDAIEHAKKNNSNLHLMGLVSDGGVHSHISHLFALLDLIKQNNFDRVFIHVITDGRDTDPMKALQYIESLNNKIKEVGIGRISSIAGRYWTMDRDKHWDRIKKSFDVLTEGVGPVFDSTQKAISENYRQNHTDEFITPTVIQSPEAPYTSIKTNDALIFFNFRADRARQITTAFTKKDFNGFHRAKKIDNLYFCTFFMEETMDFPEIKPAFNLRKIDNTLAKILAAHNLKQFHIAETEKYAHVTFFFNGGLEKPYPGEKRVLVHSPKVATYDLKPDMSAQEVMKKTLDSLGHYDFTVCNFANTDMVGHTGNIKATIKAVEKVDSSVGQIVEEAIKKKITVIVTADHGNAEQMINPNNGEPYTEHTINPVPFILCSEEDILKRPLNANLATAPSLQNVTPTILDLMCIEKPQDVTGDSLLIK